MRLNGCDILMEVLIEQGVDTIFGYPGGTVLNIYDSIGKYSDKLHHVLTAHEQGAAHAADGYSRASGRVGVCLATSGPGAANLVTGLATAKADSIPMIAITGNVSKDMLGTDAFQEVDTIGLSIPVTKHSFQIKRVEDLADTVREAFRVAISGRPGPVLIDIPKDVQLGFAEYERKAAVKKDEPPTPDTEKLDEAVRLINESHFPLVYVGGGVINANCADLIEPLCNKADAFAVFSMMGLTAMDSQSQYYLGMNGMHGKFESTKAFTKADVVIALGVRFTDRATGNKQKFAPNAKIIHIDIDKAELDKNIVTTLKIAGDLRTSIDYITRQIAPKKNDEWHKAIEEFKVQGTAEERKCDCLWPWEIIRAVNERTDADTNISTDVGQHQMWVAQYYKFRKPRTHMTSGGLGTMGYGMGSAIGAAIATGKRGVLFTGDGSFGMNLNEMATAVSNNLPLVIIVMNNNRLGMIRQWQSLFFKENFVATVLDRKTDFVKLAEAFGAAGGSAHNMDELNRELDKAFALNTPYLIDCYIPCDENVMPMVPPNGSADEIMLK